MAQITTPEALEAALGKCSGGETIELGDIVGPVVLRDRNFPKPVRLAGGSISLTGEPASHQRALSVQRVDGIGLIRVALRGVSIGNDHRGFLAVFEDCANVSVVGCDFESGLFVLTVTRCADVQIHGNDIHDLGSDALRLVATERASVTGNLFERFNPAPGDHPDGIQFFTAGQTRGCSDILIADNAILGDPGREPQGIFIGDELELGHQRVMIERNLITTPMWQGISAGAVRGAIIRDNVILNLPGGSEVPGGPMQPWIMAAAGAIVERNTAPTIIVGGDRDYPGNTRQGDVTQAVRDEAVAAWRSKHRGGGADPVPAPTPSPAPPDPIAAAKARLDAVRVDIARSVPIRDAETRRITALRAEEKRLVKQIGRR